MTPRLLPAAVLAALILASPAASSDSAAIALASREARSASFRAAQLDRAALQAGSAALKARAEAEAMVARIEAAEGEISAAEARMRILDARMSHQRTRLAERRQPLIRLTAALQTMSRRPPALALVQPGSVRDMTRLRALLAATVPEIRRRTEALQTELAAAERLRLLRRQALQALAARRSDLASRRTALARLEESQLRRSDALAGAALFQSDRSLALTDETRDLTDRMATQPARDSLRQDLAALPPPPLRPGPARNAPLRYRLPLQGTVVTGFGEISPAGIHARGTTIRSASETEVTAPRQARVVYAGRFRTYGETLILDHGAGWTTTITNLTALRVRSGASVQAGDPIGRAAANAEVGVELRHQGRPQPIAAFLLPG